MKALDRVHIKMQIIKLVSASVFLLTAYAQTYEGCAPVKGYRRDPEITKIEAQQFVAKFWEVLRGGTPNGTQALQDLVTPDFEGYSGSVHSIKNETAPVSSIQTLTCAKVDMDVGVDIW